MQLSPGQEFFREFGQGVGQPREGREARPSEGQGAAAGGKWLGEWREYLARKPAVTRDPTSAQILYIGSLVINISQFY